MGGIAAGIGLDVLTWFVARYGPEAPTGEPWSFRGNGALIVPLGLGPTVIAGAWTALVLHFRSSPHWLARGGLAGLVGATFPLLSIILLVAFGSAVQRASDWLSLGGVGWMLIAPVLAMRFPQSDYPHHPQVATLHIIAASGFPLAVVLGFAAASVLLPAGS